MAQNDINVAQGENKTLRLTVTDTAGSIFDLTGSTVTFTVKYNSKESANLIQKDSNTITEVNITDPTNGIAEIYLLPADTTSMVPTDYVHDVWVEDASGNQYQAVRKKKFTVLERITVL